MSCVGADVNESDAMSRTALHLAAWKGDPELVQLLLLAKASTSKKARDNFSPLHFAAQSGNVECCKILVEANPKLLHENISKGKKKPLHLAAAKNNYDICQYFISKGADPSAKTSSGQTALDFAKDERVFQFLKRSIESNLEKCENVAGKRKIAEEGDNQTDNKQSDADMRTLDTSTAEEDSSNLSKSLNLSTEKSIATPGEIKGNALRKTKKQKVSTKIANLACYDDINDDDSDT